MQQYHELKQRHPRELLFFRLGDFYELFGDDARKAAPLLEVALTQRQDVPMCGVPAHALDPYLAKLLKAGERVAIADQLEEPAAGKGLVRRDVVRVITPGSVQEDSLLSAKQHNFLVALCPQDAGTGLAAIDYSTGEFLCTELSSREAARLWDELARLAPSEIVVPDEDGGQRLRADLSGKGYAVTDLQASDFSPQIAHERLKKTLNVASLRGFGVEDLTVALCAAGAATAYLERTQCGRGLSLKALRSYSVQDQLQMDASTVDHLDLLPVPAHGRPRRSLLEVLDRTCTPMGGRLLRRRLLSPLRRVDVIQDRLQQVTFFVEQPFARDGVRRRLEGWPDMERILVRLASGNASPRDLAHLGKALARWPALQTDLRAHGRNATRLRDAACGVEPFLQDYPELDPLSRQLAAALVEAPPPHIKEGGAIRDGFHTELDELRGWIREGKQRLLELEQKERESTGIPSLKVAFNSVFGYYIEVTKTHLTKVPAHYHRKQTTANGERYITPELKEFENRILGAEERAIRLEATLLEQLRERVVQDTAPLRAMAERLAELDVTQSLAQVANDRRFRRPVVDDSTALVIRDGRHPILDDVLPAGTLVPNDLDLDGRARQILILTGPNMSGKSTYLRQTALIAILAQMGSYVPAEEARVGVLDHVFTRIGASDRLSEGESTFMVEMVETARILNHATPRSLVILDEVGRGTSTYDGMAIAAACLEYLHGGAKVLFATHFFELTAMAERLPGLLNAHVSAREWNDTVVFLHKVEPGPADRAYGVHVARLAGIPAPVVERARVLLEEFERRQAPPPPTSQPSLFDGPNDTLMRDFHRTLIKTDLENMTPVEALVFLNTWQRKLVEGTRE